MDHLAWDWDNLKKIHCQCFKVDTVKHLELGIGNKGLNCL